MMLKGSQVVNRRRLRQQMAELRLAGRTDREIAEIIGITCPTVQYVASLYLTDAVEDDGRRKRDERPRLAYEMRHDGKSFTEISQTLNISRPRAHQLVHKYEWQLRRMQMSEVLEH
jgi:hypothetical protein